jgi:hypothetical protein
MVGGGHVVVCRVCIKILYNSINPPEEGLYEEKTETSTAPRDDTT